MEAILWQINSILAFSPFCLGLLLSSILFFFLLLPSSQCIIWLDSEVVGCWAGQTSLQLYWPQVQSLSCALWMIILVHIYDSLYIWHVRSMSVRKICFWKNILNFFFEEKYLDSGYTLICLFIKKHYKE